ncbi:hypothetical protein GCM10028818_56160 [Spirosoma horti]
MATSGNFQDVYFLFLEEDGQDYMCCLHAIIARKKSISGYYIAHVIEPESEEIIFFDCADNLDVLRAQLDYTISNAGELLFCYRSESVPLFEWFRSY